MMGQAKPIIEEKEVLPGHTHSDPPVNITTSCKLISVIIQCYTSMIQHHTLMVQPPPKSFQKLQGTVERHTKSKQYCPAVGSRNGFLVESESRLACHQRQSKPLSLHLGVSLQLLNLERSLHYKNYSESQSFNLTGKYCKPICTQIRSIFCNNLF